MQHLRERQLVDRAGVGDVDAFGVAQDGELACVLLLPLRGGRLGERFTFVVENAGDAADDDLVEAVVGERYGGRPAPACRRSCCVPAGVERARRAGGRARRAARRRVEVRVPGAR